MPTGRNREPILTGDWTTPPDDLVFLVSTRGSFSTRSGADGRTRFELLIRPVSHGTAIWLREVVGAGRIRIDHAGTRRDWRYELDGRFVVCEFIVRLVSVITDAAVREEARRVLRLGLGERAMTVCAVPRCTRLIEHPQVECGWHRGVVVCRPNSRQVCAGCGRGLPADRPAKPWPIPDEVLPPEAAICDSCDEYAAGDRWRSRPLWSGSFASDVRHVAAC